MSSAHRNGGHHRPATARRAPVARLLAVVGLLLATFLVAAPANAAVIDCTPFGDAACKDMTATAECIWSNPDASTDVLWSYANPSASDIRIDVGAHNDLTPGAANQGQPTVFVSGGARNAFVQHVAAGAGTASWRLGNARWSAAGAAACATKPVPADGNPLSYLVFGAMALVVGALSLGARGPVRKPVAA